jgi:transcriptional regulator with PAS, ATPase and Fis domain
LNSPRKNKPFITVNCGAIPENLIESTLFGHEKGSFTGAVNSYCGKFKEADGGTLFLDEIGEASLSTQVKLLRAIQEGIVTPVGGKDTQVNVRIIAATNRDLQRSVAEKLFREDLYYRIKVIEVIVPPLRERPEDIEPIVLSISSEQNRKRGTTKVFLKSTIRVLGKYEWPGNVRELENTVLATMAESVSDTISPSNLPQSFIKIVKNEAAKQSSFREYIELMQKEYLETVLSDSSTYNEAAKKAGLPASTLRDLAKRLNLSPEPGNNAFKGAKP